MHNEIIDNVIPSLSLPLLLSSAPFPTRQDDCACPDYSYSLFHPQELPVLECNDCACSETGFSFSSQPAGQQFGLTPNIHVQPIADKQYYLLFSPTAPNGPSVVNAVAWQRLQQFSNPQILDHEIDHQFVAQSLLQSAGSQPKPQASKSQTLTVWMHVTNACNLDCPYCYVRKSSEHMSDAIGVHSLQQIFATAVKHGFRRVKLKYAGGEATLHFSLIRRLHETAQRLSEEHQVELHEVLLSNGYRILPEQAQWIKSAGIKLMISLDGVGDAHDQQRPHKNGKGTFAQISHTINEVLLPLGLKPDISITVTQLNAQGIADTVRWVLERDLPVSLNFYRQNLLSSSRQELDLEEQSIIDSMSAAYQVFEEMLPLRPFIGGLLDRVQVDAHTHTCGVQHSYLVITHKGELSQCQMHLEQSSPIALEDDLLNMAHGGFIQNISVDDKDGCRSCEFRYRCTGGCPIETFRATGRWDVQSPHCRIYKTLWPQALRLEGLRLLKANGVSIL